MVEAVNHYRLLPTSILDMNKEFGYLPMLSRSTWGHLNTVTPAKLAQSFAIVGQLFGQNDTMMSWLRL
jgi:hypothetical protein